MIQQVGSFGNRCCVPVSLIIATTHIFWYDIRGRRESNKDKEKDAAMRAYVDAWSVRAVSFLTGLMGAINVISAVTPTLASRLQLVMRISPLEVRHGGRLTIALAGFALLLLAGALWRRKRVAWLPTLIILAVSIVSHMIKGLDYEEALLAAGLVLWLLFLRPHFHARSDPPSIWQGLRALVAALLFTLAYGAVGFYLLDRHFSEKFSLITALQQTITMFAEFYNPGLVPLTRFGQYFVASIYAVGATVLGYALLMLLRPVLVRRPASAAERARAKAIVEAQGRSALARFTLFDDKSYFFTPGGSMLAYVVKDRVALVLGDPVGPPGDVAEAISGFRNFCARNDWVPAFYQTLPDYLETYQKAGFETACIGREATVDVANFRLEGGANKALRSPVAKLTRLGHRVELYEPPLPDSLLHDLRAVSDEWLTMMKSAEMGFSLGSFNDDYIRSSRVVVVHTPEGFISAFANLVSEYQKNEIAIDLIRRRRQVENGTMEFLFVKIIEWARAHGYATFNLGLSALAGVGEDADDPTVEKALHYIYEHIYQFYNFKGLHAFKSKFHPEWSPRYLVYPGAASLPAVALALIRADAHSDRLEDYVRELFERRFGRHKRMAGSEMPASKSTDQAEIN